MENLFVSDQQILNSYIRHYEGLDYNIKQLHESHRRARRSASNPHVKLDFKAHGRYVHSTSFWQLIYHCFVSWGLSQIQFMGFTSKCCQNIVWCNLENIQHNDPIKLEFCTCPDSRAVLKLTKFWADWIIRLKTRANSIFVRTGLWAHNLLQNSPWALQGLNHLCNEERGAIS